MGPLITGIGASLGAFEAAKWFSDRAGTRQSSSSAEAANSNSKPVSSSGRSLGVLAMSAPVLKAA